MKGLSRWFRWLFRRGVRGVLLLNMRPGDEVVSMVAYRDKLAVITRGGEVWIICEDRFCDPWDLPDMTVHRVKP